MTGSPSQVGLLEDRLLQFALFLRENQLACDPSALIDANQVLVLGYARERSLMKNGLRSCFCKSAADWQRFDDLFDYFWSTRQHNTDNSETHETANATQLTATGDAGSLVGFAGTSSQQVDEKLAGAGDFKALSLADFRFVFNPLEMQLIENLVDDLARRSRHTWMRRKVKSRKGQQLDPRATLQRSFNYGGQVAELRYLKRQRKLPSFVLLIDVSQSMEVYAKLFLRFICRLMTVFKQTDAFAFNTQLMELGSGFHNLSETDMENALNNQQQRWLGGTKIAYSLECFNRLHARQMVNHKTTVVIFSDGCDTAPPEELAAQVAQIQQRAMKLIWVNPLLGRFKPGELDPYMDPVAPFVDRYRSAHNLDTLQLLTTDLLSWKP